MPALFRHGKRAVDENETSSEAVAALIANLQSKSGEQPAISHREFRDYIRDRDRSGDDAWSSIRDAARNNGR